MVTAEYEASCTWGDRIKYKEIINKKDSEAHKLLMATLEGKKNF